jgi:hypothetical protein
MKMEVRDPMWVSYARVLCGHATQKKAIQRHPLRTWQFGLIPEISLKGPNRKMDVNFGTTDPTA